MRSPFGKRQEARGFLQICKLNVVRQLSPLFLLSRRDVPAERLYKVMHLKKLAPFWLFQSLKGIMCD